MKCIIRNLTFILMVSFIQKISANENPILILHGHNERMEAFWVTSLLIKRGIPEDFIVNIQSKTPCTYTANRSNSLLILCIDNNKKLHIVKFKSEEFFWQFKPLID